MQHDVQFLINSGDYQGKKYGYTLASNKGQKMWERTPVFYPAPSMIKEQIKMTILAREDNISRSGARELKQVDEIIDELTTIATASEHPTLTGLDLKDRYIQIDQNGFNVKSVVLETNKEPEYVVELTCWGLYDY